MFILRKKFFENTHFRVLRADRYITVPEPPMSSRCMGCLRRRIRSLGSFSYERDDWRSKNIDQWAVSLLWLIGFVVRHIWKAACGVRRQTCLNERCRAALKKMLENPNPKRRKMDVMCGNQSIQRNIRQWFREATLRRPTVLCAVANLVLDLVVCTILKDTSTSTKHKNFLEKGKNQKAIDELLKKK